MKSSEVPMPECERMKEVSEVSQKIGEFIDWMRDEHGGTFQTWEKVEEEVICPDDELHKFRPQMCVNCHGRESYKVVEFEGYVPTMTQLGGIEKALAKFFNIDLNKVEEERRALLEAIRRENNS